MNERTLPVCMPRNDFLFNDDRSHDIDLILGSIILAHYRPNMRRFQLLRFASGRITGAKNIA